MPFASANGLSIAYECDGDPAGAPMVLVMGLGMPLVFWPDEFVASLAAHGFRLVRFDNRDCGHSTRLAGRGPVNLPAALARAMLGLPVPAPYTLADMADDSVGLLDALGIRQAHFVGVSMGGMIAQTVAARHPARVASLVSIMSSTGNRRVMLGRPRALRALLSRPKDATSADAVVAHMMGVLGAIGSPRYPLDPQLLRHGCERVVARGYYPAGTARQLLAIAASGDRRRELARITAPTLVIHGREDPLVRLAAGKDTARNIPGAQLLVIEGMGHDLPPALMPRIVDAIAAHAREAESRRHSAATAA
jgi:proline iminopeptidase